MDMIGHDNVGVNIQVRVLLAPGKVFDDEIVVITAGKYVYPIYHG
jgi:hypothetical protein